MGLIGPPVGPVIDGVLLGAGIVAGAEGAYLLGLAVAALGYKNPPGPERASARLVVLIPAYNEADLIERCIDSLTDQSYPRQCTTSS